MRTFGGWLPNRCRVLGGDNGPALWWPGREQGMDLPETALLSALHVNSAVCFILSHGTAGSGQQVCAAFMPCFQGLKPPWGRCIWNRRASCPRGWGTLLWNALFFMVFGLTGLMHLQRERECKWSLQRAAVTTYGLVKPGFVGSIGSWAWLELDVQPQEHWWRGVVLLRAGKWRSREGEALSAGLWSQGYAEHFCTCRSCHGILITVGDLMAHLEDSSTGTAGFVPHTSLLTVL